jgi:gamma-glutamylcyclotransferase (GGCT)/AIG2-like uncharacterized protein YtfP
MTIPMLSAFKHLFVYGTLRRGTGHPMAFLLEQQARCVGPAQVPGRLYDLGCYPGLVEAVDAVDWVQGDLFELNDPETTLPELDRYEGCGPDDPRPWFFQRSAVLIRTADGTEVPGWVYRYCRPVAEEHRIASGEYYRDDLKNFDWRTTLAE